MFIQVIEGKTRGPRRLHERLEVWKRDLMPGAIGYLGIDGRVHRQRGLHPRGPVRRTRRPRSATSNRPEQTAWWQETEKLFDGRRRRSTTRRTSRSWSTARSTAPTSCR